MRLKEYRDYFHKMAGFSILMNSIFLLMMSGLAVLMSDNGEDAYSNVFRTTFVVGSILVIFSLASGFGSFFRKSEGSSFLIKYASSLNAIMSTVFSFSAVLMYITKSEIREDMYTRNIYIIAIAAGLLSVLFAVTSFIANLHARRYLDHKNHFAKEIPTGITEARVKEIYYGIVNIVMAIFAISVGFMAMFFATEIKEYAVDFEKEVLQQKQTFMIMFVITLVLAVLLATASALSINGITLFRKIGLALSIGVVIALLIIVAICISIIGSGPEQKGYTDITYIVFTCFMVFMALLMSIGSIRASLLFLKQN